MLCAWLEKFRRIGFMTSDRLRCANPRCGLRQGLGREPIKWAGPALQDDEYAPSLERIMRHR